MRKEHPIITDTQITLFYILVPSTQNETIYRLYNYGMQTHTQMEMTKKINSFKHNLVLIALYSQWHNRITGQARKTVLYRKEFNAVKILVCIRDHVLDISWDSLSI